MFESIAKLKEDIKRWSKTHKDTVWEGNIVFLSVMLLVGIFRLGVLWHNKIPITLIEQGEREVSSEKELYGKYITASGLPGLIAASRNGKRYYYPWCEGLNRIKESNRVWFDSKKRAQAAGYTIASRCEEPEEL